jgi:ABC-2 type transport system ATP-binding protein
MPQNVAISAERISKSYGSFRAVHNLSFEVYGGEIFAMLGPNGAGKSTTIRMILDILKPDAGKIAVFGAPINDESKNKIGYLPEERGLYRNVPVLEMMVYLAMLKGLSQADAKTRAMRYLEQVDLAEHAKKKVSELSKGMQQKVQFGVTVLHDPTLIIIDEPFSGLDPVNTRVIEGLLRDFRAKGGAIVMSTHQMYQVEEMADRLLMIDRGERQLYGSVSDVRAQYALPAVHVEGRGDWASVAGVDRVELRENGRPSALLYLKPNVTPDDVLGEMAKRDDIFIQRFELAVPSLNDIFIQVAAGGRDRE